MTRTAEPSPTLDKLLSNPRFIGTDREALERSACLLPFVESHGATRGQASAVRYADGVFQRFLRREPRLADLNQPALTAFFSWMRGSGYAGNTADKIRVAA